MVSVSDLNARKGLFNNPPEINIGTPKDLILLKVILKPLKNLSHAKNELIKRKSQEISNLFVYPFKRQYLKRVVK